jgi:hypothetical protein
MTRWKNFIRHISGEKRLLKRITRATDDICENRAQLFISNLINGFFPVSSWSMRPSLIVSILNDVLLSERTNIIEFGSGISTICIAQVIRQYNLDVSFVAIEHDETWFRIIEKYLTENNLSGLVDYQLCALQENNEGWYKLPGNIISKKYDQLILDGPPNSVGRKGFLEFLKFQYLDNRDFCIIIDDSQRTIERELVLTICKEASFANLDYKRSTIICPKEKVDIQRNLLYG